MMETDKREKQGGLQILIIIGALLLVFNHLFIDANVNLSHFSTLNSNYIWQLIQGVANLGIDLTVIGLGFMLAKYKNSITLAIKSWIMVWLTGVTVLISVLLLNNVFTLENFYNAIFPIIRGTYPIVTGILLGILFMPLIRYASCHYSELVFGGIVVTIIAPSLFNRPLWGSTDINFVFYGFIMFALGIWLKFNSEKLKTRKAITLQILIVILNEILIAVMPAFSWALRQNLSTAGRFTNSSCGLQILTAMILVNLFSKIKLPAIKNSIIYYWILVVVCGNYTGYLSQNITQLNQKFQNIPFTVAKMASKQVIIFVAFCLLGTLVVLLINHLFHLDEKINSTWDGCDLINFNTWWNPKILSAKKWIKQHAIYLIGLAIAYLLSFCSFVAVSDNFRIRPNINQDYNVFTYTLGTRQLFVIINMLLLLMLFKFIWALTNRFWLASISSGVFFVGWIIGNVLKIQSRSETILPSDLSMLKNWNELLSMVGVGVTILAVAMIVIAGVLIWFLEKKKPIGRGSWPKRIFWLLVIPIISCGANYLNHKDSPIYTVARGINDYTNFFNQWGGSMINGPTLQFINNIDITIMDKPQGYSKAEIKKLCEKYKNEADEINKERTNQLKDQIVIYNLSESFADPSRLTGVKLKSNPIPNIQKIKKDNTSGIMLSPSYGGGTANIEYMTLTGLATCNFASTLQIPYTQLVGKMKKAPSIVQQFPEAIAIHPYLGTFYNRQAVYKKFGIDKFYYLGSKYKIIDQKKIGKSPYLSDETAYDNALEQIKNSDKSGLFINLVTMQNHFPYDEDVYKDSDKFNGSGASVDEATREKLNNYTYGLNYTDKAAQKFMEELDKIQKPVTWVFYGDHLPGLYGVLASDMQKYGLELHETDYFIYSNKYAQEHLGAKRLTTYTNYVTPNEFSAMVAEQTNSKVTPFLALLTQVYQKLPAITMPFATDDDNAEPTMVNQNGQIISSNDLTEEQKELWHDYKLLQYDITAGKQYSIKYSMFK